MVSQSRVTADTEPTPEFNSECMGVILAWQQGDLAAQDAIQALNELGKEANKMRHAANQGRAEHLSGYIQHYVGNYNLSNMHYQNARRHFERVNNQRHMTTMDLNMGENYRYKGEFKRARRLFRNVYEAAVRLDNLQLQTIAITNVASILLSTKDHESAREAFEEALRLSDEWDEGAQLLALRTEIYYGLAEVELILDNLNVAWDCAYLSLNSANASSNLHSVGLAYRILGDAQTALGEPRPGAAFKTPDQYYRAAQDVFRELDAQAEIGRTMYHHALSLAERGQRRSAARLFHAALEIFSQLGMTNDAALAAEAQLRVF